IEFANLDDGDYTLRIKAKTRHGVVGEENIIKFTIKPPFWKSSIAIYLYILLIILLVIQNKYKVRKLDKLVNKKTKDLIVEMNRNEELFNKVLILEKNKNNYFVNLSHELRTPLNVLTSINQLIKDLQKKELSIPPEKLSYYMDIMGKNTDRLLNLYNVIFKLTLLILLMLFYS
ncbi:MAG: histidine kinase, partial [Clostridium sp.]|nr:histidine kinase [Clostridium sp.]